MIVLGRVISLDLHFEAHFALVSAVVFLYVLIGRCKLDKLDNEIVGENGNHPSPYSHDHGSGK